MLQIKFLDGGCLFMAVFEKYDGQTALMVGGNTEIFFLKWYPNFG